MGIDEFIDIGPRGASEAVARWQRAHPGKFNYVFLPPDDTVLRQGYTVMGDNMKRWLVDESNLEGDFAFDEFSMVAVLELQVDLIKMRLVWGG